jgi:hypothetical protein
LAFFFLTLGIIIFLLPLSMAVRSGLLDFILNNTLGFTLFGLGFMAIGVLLCINLWVEFKKRYYYVSKGTHTVKVDETLVCQYLKTYWEQRYPQQEIPTRVTLKKNKIEISSTLPNIPEAEREALCIEVKNEVRELFNRVLDYSEDIALTISFKK